jgi:AraC family transcriptional regulator, ethanolamine operon transcriptional activator
VVRIDDFDAIPALSPGWTQRHVQLGRGTPCARLTSARTPAVELSVIRREPGVLFQGSPPRGRMVVAVNLEGPSLHLTRHPWKHDLLGVSPAGGEFEVISTTPHTLFGLVLDPALLDEAAFALWGHRFPSSLRGPGLRFRDAASRRRLVRTWAAWMHRVNTEPGILRDAGVAATLEREVVDAVVANVDPAVRSAPLRPSQIVALRAEAFLRQSLEEPIHVDDVCAAVGTSRPVLHASFQDALGTSPMAYWRSLRLSAARADLKRARRGTTVAAVATRWGFFRLGYFSRYYRAMFGEKPSETLSRAPGRSSVDARSRLPAAVPEF